MCQYLVIFDLCLTMSHVLLSRASQAVISELIKKNPSYRPPVSRMEGNYEDTAVGEKGVSSSYTGGR